MSFGVGNNKVGLKSVTLEDLTKGLDPKKDKKQIERIKIAFDYFNKPGADGKKDDALSYEEQIAMLNFMNKADSAESSKRDGKVTRKGLRQVRKQNGLENTPKYKEYKSFLEAYQKAVAEFEKDDVAEIEYVRDKEGEYAQAKYSDNNGTTSEVYTSNVNSAEYKSGIFKDNKTGNSVRTDNKNRVVQQTVDGVTTRYIQFDSEKEDATPTVIRQGGATYTLQDNGFYKAETAAARLNNKGTLEPVEIDNKNRLTKETFNNVEYSYTYNENETIPATITTKSAQGEPHSVQFTKEGGLYTISSGRTKQYFTFDAEKHEFMPAMPPQKYILKPQYSRNAKVHQTEIWRNQRLGAPKAQELGLNDLNTAEEVLDTIINADDNLKGKNINREQLLADFIKNNPSVFVQSGDSKGVLFSDAKWDRLDFPKNLTSYITAF